MGTRWTAAALAVATLGAACLGPARAYAQAAQPSAAAEQQARDAYARGTAAFRAERYAAAEKAFEQAYAAVPNPVVLVAIAEARQRQGDVPGTIDALERYLMARPDAPDAPAMQARLDALRKTPATVRVSSDPAGALVLVDGAQTDDATPARLSLPPGKHRIDATLNGRRFGEREVTALPGGHLDVTLGPLGAATTPPAASTRPPSGEAEGAPAMGEGATAATGREAGRHATKAVWATFGVALAAGATGAVLGGVALKKQKDFDAHPTNALADKGERIALFADVSFGIAAGAAITSLVLYLTSGSRGEHDEGPEGSDAAVVHGAPRVAVEPAVGRAGGGAVLRLRF